MKIECKGFASIIKQRAKENIEMLGNIKKEFHIFQVGDNPASNAYVKGKINDCYEIGVNAILHKYSENTNKYTIKDDMKNVGKEWPTMLQLPLPDSFDVDHRFYKDCIAPQYDVDAMFYDEYEPCTPLGIYLLMKELLIDPNGKVVAMLGRSDLVGKPMARILQNNDATVSVLHSHTPDWFRNQIISSADIVITAVGKPGVVQSNKIKSNALVIDVGITRCSDGKLHGDFEIDPQDEKRIDYTPVPGGVGLMTRAALMHNLAKAFLEKYNN